VVTRQQCVVAETASQPVALVTGAGSGIGRAAALALAREGYRIALVGRRVERLKETAALLPPGASLCLRGDVGDVQHARNIVDRTVERFGRLDVLVNNAGCAPKLPIEAHSPGLIEETYRINALAPAWTIARAWPIFLRQRGGCIINISTLGTIDPFPGFFAYAPSKAAVNLMARCCANEGKVHGIRAFAIAPAAVETDLLRSIIPESVIPRDRAMPPERIAEVIMACVRGERDAENGGVIVVEA
jgi:NAD(P)-dependent dehydrogenase (short-subunit alcohol dehydrogenase family)